MSHPQTSTNNGADAKYRRDAVASHRFRRSSTNGARAADWLWTGRLERGQMTLVAGEPGVGKGLFLMSVAATISNGSNWPGGGGRVPIGHTVIYSPDEDYPSCTLPRLKAAEANLKRVCLIDSYATLQDLRYWDAVFDSRPNTAAFILDPLDSRLGKGIGDRQVGAARKVLGPFVEKIIKPRRICFIGTTLLKNAINVHSPLSRVSRSIPCFDLASHAILLVRDEKDRGLRHIRSIK